MTSVIFRFIAAASATILVTGCGGGDVSSTPTPTPVPTPTPTPSPAPFPLASTVNYSSITGTSTYSGEYGDGIGKPSTAQVQIVGIAGLGSQPAISYNATTGTYTLQSGAIQLAVTSADRVAASGFTHAFHKAAGSVTDDLTLYGNALSPTPGVTAPVALSYTSFGFWKHIDSSANLTTQTFFLYGEQTAAADMPRSGTASYQATASGLVMNGPPAMPTNHAFTGSASISADFSANTIATVLDLGGSGSYQGSGVISSNQFSGSLSAPYLNFVGGNFMGGFFGPQAAEVGYTFWFRYHNPDPYAGASVGSSDIYYSGVVAGRKN